MARMVVTLDVSRLSGWLNADEYCHSTGGHTKRGARRGQGDGVGAWGGGGGRGVQGEGPTGRATRGEVRTQNMMRMLVTLDVSRLSG